MAQNRWLPVLREKQKNKNKKTCMNSTHSENIHHGVQGSILPAGSSGLLMRQSKLSKTHLVGNIAVSPQVTLERK